MQTPRPSEKNAVYPGFREDNACDKVAGNRIFCLWESFARFNLTACLFGIILSERVMT